MAVMINGGSISIVAACKRLSENAISRSPADQDVIEAFNALDQVYTSTEKMLESFEPLIAAKRRIRIANLLTTIKLTLLSKSNIMRGRPLTQRLESITELHKPHVKNVINGITPYTKKPHATDPATGSPANGITVKEFYLPDVQGGRMTLRNQNGKICFYYNSGGHAHNQYYYALIVDSNGLPILRGSYPEEQKLII